jgi:hypothetical protein
MMSASFCSGVRSSMSGIFVMSSTMQCLAPVYNC